ncbi:MAG: homoserine dehydrogenase [Alphaproteobacteria bacterium]|nr:homoserine dehydrogenase [Alphaproteobacteria bacterium]
MGKGILYQTLTTPGVACVALCDIRVDVAVACALELGIDHAVVESVTQLEDAVRTRKVAICADGLFLSDSTSVEILVEASSAITEGARFVTRAIETGKHVVLMNAEIDLAFGTHFLQLAEEHGVVVTSCDGDQHGVLKRQIDDMNLWGFETVMAGNIKGFLDRYANPTTIIPEADKRKLNYKMCTAYTDGTKLCIEMALIANALGLKTPLPGMTGPRADHVDEVLSLFDFENIRASGKPVVDYILGARPGGGVYSVGYHDHPFQSFMMNYYKMGDGPFYVFYRPYHLCHVESIASIVMPVLDKTALLTPSQGIQTDTFAYAKKDLRPGEMLDGIGGHACYGLIENVDDPATHPGLQICVAEDVRLKNPIKKDQPILLADVEVDPLREDFKLRELAVAASRNG